MKVKKMKRIFEKLNYLPNRKYEKEIINSLLDLRDIIINSILYYDDYYEGEFKDKNRKITEIFSLPLAKVQIIEKNELERIEIKEAYMEFSLYGENGDSLYGEIKIDKDYLKLFIVNNETHPQKRIKIGFYSKNSKSGTQEFVRVSQKAQAIIETTRRKEIFWRKILELYEIPYPDREIACKILEIYDVREILKRYKNRIEDILEKEKELLLSLPSVTEIEQLPQEKAVKILREKLSQSVFFKPNLDEMTNETLLKAYISGVIQKEWENLLKNKNFAQRALERRFKDEFLKQLKSPF